LRREAAAALIAARERQEFASIQELGLRVPELRRSELTLLAKVGALNTLLGALDTKIQDSKQGANTLLDGLSVNPDTNGQGVNMQDTNNQGEAGAGRVAHRRDALWQVEYAGRLAGPLLDELQEEEDGSAGIFDGGGSPLRQMTTQERLVADFAGTGVTVGRHPMAFQRARLQPMGIRTASELARMADGQMVRIAGSVIARQRPGTAKGFVFLSLEDETGIANAILTPAVYEQYKQVVVYGKYLLIEGKLQNQENVVSVKAREIRGLEISEAEVRSHDFH
jgi:error-prone DNA polymerase